MAFTLKTMSNYWIKYQNAWCLISVFTMLLMGKSYTCMVSNHPRKFHFKYSGTHFEHIPLFWNKNWLSTFVWKRMSNYKIWQKNVPWGNLDLARSTFQTFKHMKLKPFPFKNGNHKEIMMKAKIRFHRDLIISLISLQG